MLKWNVALGEESGQFKNMPKNHGEFTAEKVEGFTAGFQFLAKCEFQKIILVQPLELGSKYSQFNGIFTML